MEAEDESWQRLDKFLFFARFCRTRVLAAELVGRGMVRINRQPAEKSHARLRPGDVLTIALASRVVVAKVVALAPRRGPPAQARLLYEEIG